jgi:CarboxypepD_reg-like domain/TonB-dependent Receptor Plug Domain
MPRATFSLQALEHTSTFGAFANKTVRMRHSWLGLFFFCSFFILVTEANGQKGAIRGFVYDKETGEPVIYTPVKLVGKGLGANTDVNGFFSLTKLDEGEYEILVVSLGFDTLSQRVQVGADQIRTERLYLIKSVRQLTEFQVSADKQESQNSVRMSVTKLTPKQIERLPSVGGESDLAQYLQVVPGVVFTGDQGGQLYVRGGSPIMNKVMMDGLVLYNPFHSIGLFSVFDNDIIRNADVYTAGFNAEYGGRMSSMMDVTTREGNRTRLSGKVAASTFAAKAMIEGPLKKQTDASAGSSSFLLNLRHSYLDQSSKSLYSYVDSAGLPFTFTDAYGKVSFNGSNGSKLNLFGFNFTDGVRYQGVSDLNWNNWGAGANFVLVPGGSATLIDGNFGTGQYEIELAEGDLPARRSSISGFNAALNFKYFVRENEVRYGVEILGFKTDFSFFNTANRRIEQVQNTSEIAAYFNYKLKLRSVVIDPGLRLQYYATYGVPNLEPRLGFKWNVNDDWRVKFSVGRYSQNLVAANNDRDVVNLFYGFLSSPEDLPSTLTTESGEVREIKDPIQRANHAVVGVEHDISANWSLNVEGYVKDFRQVTNLNRNKLYDDTQEFADQPDELKKDFIVETGIAYGADMLLKYEKNRTYVWFVYGLNFVERYDGAQSYRPVWDRRHNLNLVVSYTWGTHDSWKASARFNYGSGFPFSQTQGFYGQLPATGGIGTDITQVNADLALILGPLNAGRLPDYHRLDLGVTKTWKFSERSLLELDLGATNVYDRDNVFYVDRVRGKRVDQLPILPSAGVSYQF